MYRNLGFAGKCEILLQEHPVVRSTARVDAAVFCCVDVRVLRAYAFITEPRTVRYHRALNIECSYGVGSVQPLGMRRPKLTYQSCSRLKWRCS